MALIPVNPHQVAQADLIRSQQIRQRINDMPLDGTLQVAGAIALIRAFLEQKLAAGIRHAKEELPLGCVQDPLLHLPQLNIEHFLKLLAPQWMEDHHLVQAVHEFRRKLAPSRFHGRALHFLVQPGDRLILGLNKTHSTLH